MKCSERHLDDLRSSGLTDKTILAADIYTAGPEGIEGILGWQPKSPGLVFPIPDGGGQVKLDTPRRNKKTGKPIKYESPRGESNRAYLSPDFAQAFARREEPILITEGAKKCLAIWQAGFACVGLTGVWNWQVKRKREDGKAKGQRILIPDLKALEWIDRAVVIVFDSDVLRKPNIRQAEHELSASLREKGARVRVARIPAAGGEKIGADDYIVAQGPKAFRRIIRSALHVIPLGVDEHRVIGETIDALRSDVGLYRRGDILSRIIRTDFPDDEIRRPDGTPIVTPIPLANLRERMTRHCVFIKLDGRSKQHVEARPPGWLVSSVHARGEWPALRSLRALSDVPVLRSDGTVHDRPGYDAQSGVLYDPSGESQPIPDNITLDDAKRAKDELYEVIEDFRFVNEAHRAAWLAALLTPFARTAYTGCSPLFLFDANVRGAGKGLLTNVIANIYSGRNMAMSSYTDDESELRKRITSLAMSGDQVVSLDNITGAFGNATLDRALTATRWQDRILGLNRDATLPLRVVWFGTGNNVEVREDTLRRIVHCRLEVLHEMPEERTNFRHPDLLPWVRGERPRLVRAALTILTGYIRAGRPKAVLTGFGSFEGWADLVRQAVVWLGEPDPCQTRIELTRASDTDGAGLFQLMAAWERVYGKKRVLLNPSLACG